MPPSPPSPACLYRVRRREVHRLRCRQQHAATVVLAVTVNDEFDVSVAVTLCGPVASNVTWNKAQQLESSRSARNTAVASVVLDSFTVSVKLDTGWLLTCKATDFHVLQASLLHHARARSSFSTAWPPAAPPSQVLAVTMADDEFVVSMAVTLVEPMASNVTWTEA